MIDKTGPSPTQSPFATKISPVAPAAIAGLLDPTGNILFVLSLENSDLLSILLSVAMAPSVAATLSVVSLAERLRPAQVVGIVIGVVALAESPWVSFRAFLLEDGTVSNDCPVELCERALRMLAVAAPDHASDFAAASHVAGCLGVNPDTLRAGRKRADIDAGREAGTSSEAQLEIKRLKEPIVELEKAIVILHSASVFFATELGRPSSR